MLVQAGSTNDEWGFSKRWDISLKTSTSCALFPVCPFPPLQPLAVWNESPESLSTVNPGVGDGVGLSLWWQVQQVNEQDMMLLMWKSSQRNCFCVWETALCLALGALPASFAHCALEPRCLWHAARGSMQAFEAFRLSGGLAEKQREWIICWHFRSVLWSAEMCRREWEAFTCSLSSISWVLPEGHLKNSRLRQSCSMAVIHGCFTVLHIEVIKTFLREARHNSSLLWWIVSFKKHF